MKIDKYDRQVRIWGAKGQKKLTFAKVAILGCSGALIEAAKNLILPGIGRIDILDDKLITVQDLASSFFFTHESVGKFKGQEASYNLLEMNPDVEGHFKEVSIQTACSAPEAWLKGYDLVVCGNLTEQQNKNVSKICWEIKLPVIFITSVGFFFHIRTQKQLHIVESQNISAKKYYLRLHDPFEGLNDYVNQKKLPQLISKLKQNKQNFEAKQGLEKQFGKITYPVFLTESFKQLKTTLGRVPKTAEVKELLTEWKYMVSQDLDIRNGINEAITRAFDLYQTSDNFLPAIDVFEDQNVVSATNSSEFIYVFLKAVKEFMARHNQNLPQIVRLPDISTSTKDYLELKEIYKNQHNSHLNKLQEIIHVWWPDYVIDTDLLSEYVNNIDGLKIVMMKPYFEELENPDTIGSSINWLGDVKNLLLALRTFKMFEQESHRYPLPSDFDRMKQISKRLEEKWGLTETDERFLKEICRYDGKSLISYDSMAGAIAGQQAVKMITQCFSPLNNGYFFDGLQCKGYTITL